LITFDFNEHGQFSSSIVPAEAFGLGDRAARLIPSGDLAPKSSPEGCRSEQIFSRLFSITCALFLLSLAVAR